MKPIEEKEIPENYVKFIEPVFPEEQNTIEKCWSFNTKIYEIQEDKIKELVQHQI